VTIGVDTGGTFADLVHVKSDGTVETAKRPSTPSNFAAGVIDLVSAASAGQTMLAEAGYFYHGTTFATNAMITGSGAKMEVFERVDHAGRVVVPLNDESARRAVRELVAEGVQAIGVWEEATRQAREGMRAARFSPDEI
jgi:N-methylhydantoinase A